MMSFPARLPRRITDKIRVDANGCWRWLGYISAGGYGQSNHPWEHSKNAHRVVYEMLRGRVGKDRHMDHLCRVRDCVNPSHVDPVTCRENLLRGTGFGAVNARKDHCHRGHPLAGDNLHISSKGQRICRSCARQKTRRLRAKRRRPRGD